MSDMRAKCPRSRPTLASTNLNRNLTRHFLPSPCNWVLENTDYPTLSEKQANPLFGHLPKVRQFRNQPNGIRLDVSWQFIPFTAPDTL